MPEVTLRIHDQPLTLAGTADLSKFLKPGPGLVLSLKPQLPDFGNLTLDSIPETALSLQFSPSQGCEWFVGPAKIRIGFEESFKGAVGIHLPGQTFSDDKITVPPGCACLSIAFEVTLGVGGGVAFSSGNLGVRADAGANARFEIANYKIFPLTAKAGDAVREAFQSFVFPFNAEAVDGLSDRDAIEFDVCGKFALGCGVHYGFGGLLGGRSNGEIARAFESDLGKVVVSARPAFKIGADLAVRFEHEDTFRVVVQRRKSDGANAALLSLYRADSRKLGVSATLGVTLSAEASVNLQPNLDKVIDETAGRLFRGLPEPAQSAAVRGFKEKLRRAENAEQLQRYVQEANERVEALLKRAGDRRAEFQILHEREARDSALLKWSFDFNQPVAKDAYDLAMEGNCVEAMARPGVELLPDSYLEQAFLRRTALRLQLFDIARFGSVEEYFKKSSLIYTGEGAFRLRYTTGVRHEQGRVGHEKGVEVFFTAEARAAAEEVSDLAVKLHFIITDKADRKAAARTLRVLRQISPIKLSDAADRIDAVVTANKNAVSSVTCVFPQGALADIPYDDVDGDPRPAVQPNDKANYSIYVAAVDHTESGGGYHGEGFPDRFTEYERWALYNRTAIDQEDSPHPPDRKSRGNMAIWPGSLAAAVPQNLDRFQIVANYLDPARKFMNLCESLHKLSEQLDEAQTEHAYGELLKTLDDVIEDDVPLTFYRATLLALCRVMKVEVTGTPQVNETGGRIAVTFETRRMQ